MEASNSSGITGWMFDESAIHRAAGRLVTPWLWASSPCLAKRNRAKPVAPQAPTLILLFGLKQCTGVRCSGIKATSTCRCLRPVVEEFFHPPQERVVKRFLRCVIPLGKLQLLQEANAPLMPLRNQA